MHKPSNPSDRFHTEHHAETRQTFDPGYREPERVLDWVKIVAFASAGFLLSAATSYGAMIFLNSSVPDEIPAVTPQQVWADPKIGTAIELVQRQISDNRWPDSLPAWHPKARLVALPAFQSGVADSLSAFVRLRASLVSSSGAPDQDLVLAANMISQPVDQATESRLFAAVEAMRRFDGLKARSVLSDLSMSDILINETNLFEQLISDSLDELRQAEASGDRGLYSQTRTQTYFRVKGRLHTLTLLMLANRPDDVLLPGYRNALVKVNDAFATAIAPSPFLVSSGTGSGKGDIGRLNVLLEACGTALTSLSDVLQVESGSPEMIDVSKS